MCLWIVTVTPWRSCHASSAIYKLMFSDHQQAIFSDCSRVSHMSSFTQCSHALPMTGSVALQALNICLALPCRCSCVIAFASSSLGLSFDDCVGSSLRHHGSYQTRSLQGLQQAWRQWGSNRMPSMG